MPNKYRCTEAEVKAILPVTSKLDDLQIETFLKSANVLVTDTCVGAYSAEILAEIEKNLAAHFIGVRDPQIRRKSIGDEVIDYMVTSIVGEGLRNTLYGQNVMLFDKKGLLSRGTTATSGGTIPGSTFIETLG